MTRPVRASSAHASLAEVTYITPADDHGRHFQPLGIGRMEDPGCAEPRDICGGDFVQAAVATPGVVAVIGSPVGAGRLRKQIVRAHVHVGNNGSLPLLPCRGDQRQQTASASTVNSLLNDFMSVVFDRANWNFLKRTAVEPIPVFQMKRNPGGLCRRCQLRFQHDEVRWVDLTREAWFPRWRRVRCRGARPNVPRKILQRNPRDGCGLSPNAVA